MPLDGVTAHFLARELNQQLAGSRVDRIFQPERKEILLILRQPGQTAQLLVSANPESSMLFLTDEKRPNPQQAPPFCMMLRKYLSGARLLSVNTADFERVFTLRFETFNELGDRVEKALVLEVMGHHSNLMLLNAQGVIHDAVTHVDAAMSRVREVMPARIYTPPPRQDKRSPVEITPLTRDWLASGAESKPLENAVVRSIAGFSPFLAREVVWRAGLDERLHPANLSPEDMAQLTKALASLCDEIQHHPAQPTLYSRPDQPEQLFDYHALSLSYFPQQMRAQSISAAMDRFARERREQRLLQQQRQAIRRTLTQEQNRIAKKLAIHEQDVRDGEQAEQLREKGELILSQIQQIPPGAERFQAVNYYDPDLALLTIPLDPRLSPADNAQRYFRRYTKAKTKLKTGRQFVQQEKAELAWLESLELALQNAETLLDLQAVSLELTRQSRQRDATKETVSPDDRLNRLHPGKPGKRKYTARRGAPKKSKQAAEQPLPPRAYQSSDNILIQVGRNNLQNDQLTFKKAHRDDIWLHVQKAPGTHVLIRSAGRPVPDQTLLEAAQLAAWFSRPGHLQQGSKTAVDYCLVRHVRKPAGSKPGHVIYDHYKTLLVEPVEPAVLLAATDPEQQL